MLVVLIIGTRKAKRNINLHYKIMSALVSVNLLSILLIMIPSGIRILSGSQLSVFTFLVWLHLIFGIIVEVAGIVIILNWYLKKNCSGYTKYMRLIAFLWIVLILSGIIIYFFLH
jgi:uncharacterized membrane protein YozB (DUF420 family)